MIAPANLALPVETAVKPVMLAYTSYGEKATDKSPLILLHGLLARRTQWDEVARKMAKVTGGEVIAVDLRNHGDSPWTEEFSHRHTAADVEFLLRNIGAKDAHVLGHGFAGRTAVQLALEKPKILRSVIVSESTPFGVPPGYWRLASMLRTLKEVPIGQGADKVVVRQELDKALKSKIRSPLLRKHFLSNVQAKASGGDDWHFNLNSILKNMEEASQVPHLGPNSASPLPALFVCGEASDSLPKHHLPELMRVFPRVTVAYAGGAGYRIFHDRPIFFSQFISEFVKKH